MDGNIRSQNDKTKCVVTLKKIPPISCISMIDPEGVHEKRSIVQSQ